MADGAKATADVETKDDETSKETPPEVDPELDELLDSALEDFTKPSFVNKNKQDNEAGGDGAALWSEEFRKQASSGFEEAMQALMNDDPDSAQDFRKFAEMASKAVSGEVSDEELSIITQGFLTGLAANSGNQTGDGSNVPAISEEELSKMFSSLGSNLESGAEGDLGDMTSVMQNMMQTLLSKDLLYPALRDITDKYPDWLADNRETLEPAQYEKYYTQYHVMKEVCNEFESEQENDSSESKRLRFQCVLEKMQKMQECGHPPADLIGDMGSTLQMDGLSQLPALSELQGSASDKCTLM